MSATHRVNVTARNVDHWSWSLDGGPDNMMPPGSTYADITIGTGVSPAPDPIVKSEPGACGPAWKSQTGAPRQAHYVVEGSQLRERGNDNERGGGVYVWVEGSGLTSTKVIDALNALQPTWYYGLNKTGSGGSVGWTSATVTDGKLKTVCVSNSYLRNGTTDEDDNGDLIRTSAIAVGSNGVAYFLPRPIYSKRHYSAWNYNPFANDLLGFRIGSSNSYSTTAEAFQNIRNANDLDNSVDFAVVITFGNGYYETD